MKDCTCIDGCPSADAVRQIAVASGTNVSEGNEHEPIHSCGRRRRGGRQGHKKRCKLCHEFGHNKRSCPRAAAARKSASYSLSAVARDTEGQQDHQSPKSHDSVIETKCVAVVNPCGGTQCHECRRILELLEAENTKEIWWRCANWHNKDSPCDLIVCPECAFSGVLDDNSGLCENCMDPYVRKFAARCKV